MYKELTFCATFCNIPFFGNNRTNEPTIRSGLVCGVVNQGFILPHVHIEGIKEKRCHWSVQKMKNEPPCSEMMRAPVVRMLKMLLPRSYIFYDTVKCLHYVSSVSRRAVGSYACADQPTRTGLAVMKTNRSKKKVSNEVEMMTLMKVPHPGADALSTCLSSAAKQWQRLMLKPPVSISTLLQTAGARKHS